MIAPALVIVLLAVTSGRSGADTPHASPALAGSWRGGLQLDSSTQAFTVTLAARGRELTASVVSANGDSLGLTLEGIEVRGKNFTATLEQPGGPILFAGRIRENWIEGRCTRGGATGRFSMIRPVRLDSAASARWTGAYRLGGNELLEIMRSDAGDGTLSFSEPGGRAGPLVAISTSMAVAGPNLRDLFPVERVAVLRSDRRGASTAITWGPHSASGRDAPRIRPRFEEVRFTSDDAELSGTLTLPCGDGRRPAIVLVHGSGRATREEFGTLPSLFAGLGIASIAFDKRGCGRSTGRYHDFLPIDLLASDVLAAFRKLAERPDIDSTRIGIWAASQGGWVAARVTEKWHPAFAVLRSSPTLSVADNGLFETDNNLRGAGFGEPEVSESRRLNQLFNRMILSGGTGWDTLRTEVLRWRRAPWFAHAGLPDSLPESPAPANLRWVERLRAYLKYDPLPAWRQARIPVLAFYGGRDQNVPGPQSAADLEAALAAAGNRDATVLCYADADHWMWRVPESGQRDARRSKVEGLGTRTANWLVARARPAEPTPCPE